MEEGYNRNSYEIDDISCSNCNFPNSINQIPKGILVEDFIKKNEKRCFNCECLLI